VSAPPLLFLGERRRAAIVARTASAARRWRQHWVPAASDEFDATCDAPQRGGFAAPVAAAATSCWALEVAGERVAVLLLPHGTFAWCVLESGAPSLDLGGAPGGESLASSLEKEVARSLLAETCLREPREVANVAPIASAEIAEWSRSARAWTLSLRSPACARGCVLLVAAARLEQLAPARTPVAGERPGVRREAIGENFVALRAVVGETALSVPELAGLALDDVLVLDQRLTEPVALVSPGNGTAVAAGNLGRSGSRRAIKVAAIQNRN